MDYISSSFKTVFHNCLNLTPEERIKAKSKVYFINDSLKINKLAYAYFLDRFLEKKDLEALKRYEWFAGSLTAEKFTQSLNDFLSSPESSEVSPTLKSKLEDFVAALQNSQTQGYLIDLIRSNDLKLIFLILTGIPLGGTIDVKPEEIQEISHTTVNQLYAMKDGDKKIFLLGDLLHETRMMIEKQEKGWEISYFDSNQQQYEVFKSGEHSPILETLFWDKIYALKFSPNKINELKTHLQSTLRCVRVVVGTKPQMKNTCHFKGLLVTLKKICLSDPKLTSEERISEWKAFKLAFGQFLLKNPKLNDKIKVLATKKQESRKNKIEQRTQFLELIHQGKYEDTVRHYISALEKLGSSEIKLFEYYSQLEILQDLDAKFKEHLASHSLHLEEIESKLEINNPIINLSLKQFKTSLEEKQKYLIDELEKENNAANSSLGRLTEEMHATVDYEIIEFPSSFNHIIKNFAPLKPDQVLNWLDNVYKNPDLLKYLNDRPLFVCLLIQAIYLDQGARVKELYDHLTPRDQRVLQKGISMFDDNHNFSPRFLPHIEDSNHALDKFLSKWLIKRAVGNSSLKDIYLIIEKQKPPEINKSREQMIAFYNVTGEFNNYYLPIKPSREQILEFYDVLNEEEIKKIPAFDRMSIPAFDTMLGDVFEHIVLSGWFDLLEQAHPYLFSKMFSSYKNKSSRIKLTAEQLQNIKSFLAS